MFLCAFNSKTSSAMLNLTATCLVVLGFFQKQICINFFLTIRNLKKIKLSKFLFAAKNNLLSPQCSPSLRQLWSSYKQYSLKIYVASPSILSRYCFKALFLPLNSVQLLSVTRLFLISFVYTSLFLINRLFYCTNH